MTRSLVGLALLLAADIGGKGSGSFTYRVCNAGSTTACSNNSTVAF